MSRPDWASGEEWIGWRLIGASSVCPDREIVDVSGRPFLLIAYSNGALFLDGTVALFPTPDHARRAAEGFIREMTAEVPA